MPLAARVWRSIPGGTQAFQFQTGSEDGPAPNVDVRPMRLYDFDVVCTGDHNSPTPLALARV